MGDRRIDDDTARIRARQDQVTAEQAWLRSEFAQLSRDLYAQMHEIKRISHEATGAFDHHIELLERAKRLEERLG